MAILAVVIAIYVRHRISVSLLFKYSCLSIAFIIKYLGVFKNVFSNYYRISCKFTVLRAIQPLN
jgi:hypothetical protein